MTADLNPRILIYSHNTRGFGHANRSVALAWALYRKMPESSILYCGASLYELSELLPPNADYVKLPSFDAVTEQDYIQVVPAKLRISAFQQYQIRIGILESIANTYQPEVLVVDLYPRGKKGELENVIQRLEKQPGKKMYLGMRDILDEPIKTNVFFREEQESLKKYDRIFIYGDPNCYRFLESYEITDDVKSLMIYTGYVVREAQIRPVSTVRAELGINPDWRLVVLGTGGGKI